MRRVSVVGNSGSGKSTLGRALAARLGVPFVELDAIHHLPGWEPIDVPEFRRTVGGIVDGDGWVIDGNYSAVRDLVWARADTVVWFDLPRRTVMRQVLWRTIRRGVTREELWNGNRERLSTLFRLDPQESLLRWAWTGITSTGSGTRGPRPSAATSSSSASARTGTRPACSTERGARWESSGQVGEGGRQQQYALLDRPFRQRAVAEQQPRLPGWIEAVPAHPEDRQPPREGRRLDRRLVRSAGSHATRCSPAATPAGRSCGRCRASAASSASRRRRYSGRIRRRCRSNSPRARKSAKASWSSAGEPRSASELRLGHRRRPARGGRTSQPSRSPGARVLLAVPAYTTRSGPRPCIAPTGGPVVAVLGVVVVLDDDRAAPLGPAQHRGAGRRGQHARRSATGATGSARARRRPSGQRGRRRRRRGRRGPRPPRCPAARGERRGRRRRPTGPPPRAAVAPRAGEHPDQQARWPGRSRCRSRRCPGCAVGAAHPVEVAGERRPQLGGAAARSSVAEPVVRRLGQHPADRAQPRGARELDTSVRP